MFEEMSRAIASNRMRPVIGKTFAFEEARKSRLSLFILAVAMGLLLFLPADTIRYWQAWAYLSVFTCASPLLTLYLMRRDLALLERRMSGGPTAEKRAPQKLIMLFV
jgi:hypothetical protein